MFVSLAPGQGARPGGFLCVSLCNSRLWRYLCPQVRLNLQTFRPVPQYIAASPVSSPFPRTRRRRGEGQKQKWDDGTGHGLCRHTTCTALGDPSPDFAAVTFPGVHISGASLFHPSSDLLPSLDLSSICAPHLKPFILHHVGGRAEVTESSGCCKSGHALNV